jgi:hypothetical protein
MSVFATIGGVRATTARLCVPFSGVWFADLDLDGDAELAGAVTVQLGALTLQGTVLGGFSGAFGLGARYRVVGGAGGWTKIVKARHYHNDAGVKLGDVAATTASETGESITVAAESDRRLAADFVRAAVPASRVLAGLLGAVPWWVGYDGKTQAGPRRSVEVTADYELLDFDPRHRVATVACDDPGAIVIGAVLRDRLSVPLAVREITLIVGKEALRMALWGQEAPS